MALGHLVLPGVGILVAIGIGAYATYSKASEINRVCDEIDEAAKKNETALVAINKNKRKLDQAKELFITADAELNVEIQIATRKLRGFGWLSDLYRYLRFKINGVYYTSSDQIYVQQLEGAVDQFMSKFGTR
ncbi:hypothetical protein [Tunturiibacter gelidiferens]|uniref:hypothetical protein n=1 Tax=Tunturiibacter gelidiferens TaxID=3069689 RepID=UPI003D9BCC0C